jgi:hypothetical protein
MGGKSTRLFINHKLFIIHEMWLLMVVNQNLEAISSEPCAKSLNFEVSRYVNFISSNFQVFVRLCESQVL